MKKFFLILFLLSIFSWHFSLVRAQENIQIFGIEGQPKEKKLSSCVSGLRQFLAAGLGYQSLKDYFRDFVLWPSHYADVASVQEQLNRTRYAVIAAFLRCDTDRLKSVTEAYYRLEAELYFVRHFVDTEGGFLHILTENPGDRQKFMNDMVGYLFLLKPAENREKEKALFSGYFDLFEAKYRSRAKSYANPQGDSIFDELAVKFEKLIDTFASFKSLGTELAALGDETIVEGAVSLYDAASAVYENTGGALKKTLDAIVSKFDACVETPDSRYCLTGENVEKEGGIFAGTEFERFIQNFTRGGKKSFQDVMVAVEQQELRRTQDLDRAEMLARYEMLYGQVSGSGLPALISQMDTLLSVLSDGSKKVPGSLEPLSALQQCAAEVHNRQCQ